MFRNYLAVAIRSLNRNRIYSFINVSGLALGVGCALVITLFVIDELSYDRHHEKADRIHRVVMDAKLMGKEINGGVSPAPMGQAMVEEIPAVESATRLWRRGSVLIERDTRQFTEDVFYADLTYFEVFTHPLYQGDTSTALEQPNSIVMTERAAAKYFGDQEAMGAEVNLNGTAYVVTGIAADIPHSSHFHFDLLASLVTREDSRDQMWVSNNYYTYVLLQQGADPSGVEVTLNEMVRKYAGPQIKMFLNTTFEEFERKGSHYRFHLQPLTDIHLHSNFDMEIEPQGSIDTIYVFSSIALLVVIVACVNYTNLTTARAAKRSVEIGMRKAVGASRNQLVCQFLGESVFLAVLAFGLAVFFTYLLLPSISLRLDKPLSFGVLEPIHGLVGLGVVLATGLLAGAYPALLLSSFRPQAVLKGARVTNSRGVLRSVLVVFQFVVSVVLVVGTVVVSEQMQFVQDKDLGFEKEQVIVVSRAWPVRRQIETFKEELLRDSRIVSVAGASHVPGEWLNNSAFLPEGATGAESQLLWRLGVDEDFLKTMDMTLAEGRGFSRDFASDTSAAILNQAAIRVLGWEQPLGKHMTHPGRDDKERATFKVIGVVEDFHFESLREEIRPLIIRHAGHPQVNNVNCVVVRIQSTEYASVLATIEEKWKAIAPGHPFNYSFLNDDLDKLYRAEQKTAGITTAFSLFAIAIGCLGLFGLTSFMAEQRTKEIGLRKTLGATVTSVVQMLSMDIVKLVVIGNLIAWPIAYYTMDSWLQAFAYRMTLGPLPFMVGGSLALIVALMTVSFQTITAARRDPVEALRYE